MKTKTETRWVIVGVHGLYTRQYLTRYDAIKDHTQALGYSWEYCKGKGDFAQKVEIKYKQYDRITNHSFLSRLFPGGVLCR